MKKDRSTAYTEAPTPGASVRKKYWLWILLAVAVAAVTAWLLLRPQDGEMTPELDACVVSTLREQHLSSHTVGKYPAVAYKTLAIKEKEDTVTLYGIMMYREYTSTTQDELRVWGAAHDPFVLTATKSSDGSYTAVDCWWPEQGTGYEKSVKRKFPRSCRRQALNAQQYYAVHDAACSADARENIADDDKYVVLQSAEEDVFVAYQAKNGTAYLLTSQGYSADGTMVMEEGVSVVLTFGDRVAAFTMDGSRWVYNAKESQNIPREAESRYDYLWIAEDTVFSPVVRGETARVGDTLTIKSHSWMTEDEIKKMFGYLPNNSDATASTDRPYYLPVKVIDSRVKLDLLLSEHMSNTPWTDLKQQNFTQFDETFFEKNSLVMVYYKAGSDLTDPQVSSYVYTEEGACLSVRLNVDAAGTGDTILTQWLLFAGISKSDMEGVSVLEAYVEETASIETATALSFTGKVKQVEGNAILMECTDVPQFSSGVWVELGDAEPDPMVGETYEVTYQDLVMPSLPPRIFAVTITKP